MKKTLITSAGLLGFAISAQAAVIAVIDGGGPTAGDTAHTTIVDLSTSGDNIGAITGSFTSSGSGWRTGDPTHWNNTEWAFAPGDGNTATWTYSNLTDGTQWDVYGSWITQANRSDVAPYTIAGGSTIDVNQRLAPAADLVLSDDGGTTDFNFQKIGTATVGVGGTLVVTLGSGPNLTDNWVIADAIAIQQVVPEPSSAALLALGGFALILRRRK